MYDSIEAICQNLKQGIQCNELAFFIKIHEVQITKNMKVKKLTEDEVKYIKHRALMKKIHGKGSKVGKRSSKGHSGKYKTKRRS